jgi:uncharacterized membrane protein YjjB (DUF3815 family)
MANITARQKQLFIGAITAAAVGVITYLLGQGAIDPTIATALNAIIAGLGGYTTVKTNT